MAAGDKILNQNSSQKPLHHELEPYKKALVIALNFEAISKALQQIDQKLTNQPFVFSGSLQLHSLLTDIFKPITRQITNTYIREESKVKIMQSIIRKIIMQYISIFRSYGNSSVLQILKELLERDTFLFIKQHHYSSDKFNRRSNQQQQMLDNVMFQSSECFVAEKVEVRNLDIDYPSLDENEAQNAFDNKQFYQKPTEEQRKQQKINIEEGQPQINPQFPKQQEQKKTKSKYKWVLQTHHKYTNFYLSIIEQIVQSLEGTQNEFATMSIDSITQYYRLFYAFYQVMDRQKLLEIVRNGVYILIDNFQNPSKQLIKEANKDSLQKLSDSINQCIRYSNDFDLKVQVSLLGPTLGAQLFKQSTIFQKMQGLKIINKYASAISFRHVNYLPQSQFGRWLNNHHIFQLIYNLDSSISVLQASEDIFKFYARCKILTRQLIEKYINLIDSCQSETRIYLIKLLQSISIKIDYEEVIVILEKFQSLRKAEYYSQDFFAMISAICKYNKQSMNRKAFQILRNVVNQHYQQFPANVQSKCINCYIVIFNNIIDKMGYSKNKLDEAIKISQDFLQKPTSFNLTIMKKVFELFSEVGRVSKNTLATYVIQNLKFFDQLLELIPKHQLLLCDQLKQLVRCLLCHYRFKSQDFQLKDKDIESLFSYENMIRFAYYSEIFCLIIEFIYREKSKIFEQAFPGRKFMENLLEKLILHLETAEQCFSFQCIKIIFCYVNDNRIFRIDKDIVERQFQYSTNPHNLVGYKQLKQLLYTTKFNQIQQGCASFIVEMYTLPSLQYIEKNQQDLIQFMKESIETFNQVYNQHIVNKSQNTKSKLMGSLSLLIELLSATEPFGVGQLASHGSLVATSTILVRIYNDYTDGQDVLKVFEKKFPSNTTLFQVITQACIQFKCCSAEIMLKTSYKKFIPLKYYSWTLDEVPFNCKNLTIHQTFRNLIRKKSLLNQKGESTPQAIQAFTKIYKLFAGQGLMGKKQCSDFVSKATTIFASRYDSRITRFFQQYDKNNDGLVNLEDFLKFFYDCSVQKPDVVWKNLSSLKFRRDLKYYDEPLQLSNKKLMLRTLLCESNKIYESLFSLLQQSSHNNELQSLTKQILNRLPTYPKVINSIEQSFNLLSKNAFLSQYILIALQQQLNNKNNIEKVNSFQNFIKQKYYLKIYQYLISLDQQDKDLQKCKAICLHILRSLIPVPSLRNEVGFGKQKALFQSIDFTQQDSILYIPQNKVFQNVINDSLQEGDIETYEISLILLLTQKSFNSVWLTTGIFHTDQEIRRITCNFILLSTKINPQAFDLFEIQEQQPCNEWFKLLVQIIVYTRKEEDFNKIFQKKYQRALSRQQTLEKNYDPILYGNLNIIKTIILKSQHANPTLMPEQIQINQQMKVIRKSSFSDVPISLKVPQNFCDKLVELLSHTLSNENRKNIYKLISLLNIDKSIEVLLTLIDKQYPTREAQFRQNFVGIKNLGCICYMNSILQQFFFMADFRNFVMQLQNKKKLEIVDVKGKKIVDDFLYQLQKIYIQLLYSQKKYVDPTDFCLAIKDDKGDPISITIQQDAHQFLNQLFGTLQKYIKPSKNSQNQMVQRKQQIEQFNEEMEKIEKAIDIIEEQTIEESKLISQIEQQPDKKLDAIQNIIEKSFGGKTVTLITCRSCQNTNIRKEDITHLTVEVKGMFSLKDSFDKLTESQQICDYQCDHCKKKVPSGSIQKLLYVLPDTLIINLLRITFDVNTFQNIKVHSKHQFPDKLNLKDYLFMDQKQPTIEQQTQYYLHGVVIHSGTSQSGHYYSLIKIDNQWYKFNDMSVSKFDIKDLAKQCYGGNQINDDWGQARFSTNAYILFYSRQKKQPRIRLGSLDQAEQLKKNIQIQQQRKQTQQTNFLSNYKNSYSFLPQIVAQNKRFYFQLQINQKSFFEFAIQLYDMLKPNFIKERIQTQAFLSNWNSHPYSTRYQSLLELFLKIVNFVAVYYDFDTSIIYGIGQTTYQLFYLVPEKSYQFLMDVDPQIYFYHLITHNQAVIRQLYKCVLNKALHVYDKYYGFNWIGFKQQQMEEKQENTMVEVSKNLQSIQQIEKYKQSIPQQCRQPCNLKIILLLKNYKDKILRDDTLKKNLFKSSSFFQIWKYSIIFSNNILNFALDNNLLEDALDFIMGKDSPFKRIDQKRQECPSPQSNHLLQIIVLLQQCKLGLQDNPFPTKYQLQKPRALTYKEKKILSDPFFYKKMLRDKHDQQILPITVASLCYQNRKFSRQIAQLFITGFSTFDNYDSWNPLFAHIKMQLLLEDSFTQQRITWLLGIPQFSSVYRLDYSLRDNTGSKSIEYFSNLFFMVSQTYEPLLQRLYEKRFRFDMLTINGIITLLQLLSSSKKVLDFVMYLPPPTYNMLTYVDWIQSYVQRLESQHSLYGIPRSDKETYVEQIKKMLNEYNTKISNNKNLPSLKFIIGKNQKLEVAEQLNQQQYQIKMYRHKTYIIENLPTGTSNRSLPPDQFYYGHPIQIAKYFVHDTFSDDLVENPDINSDYTVITLQIKTKKKLRIKFNSHTFNYEITTVKGDIDINLPQDSKTLRQLVDIEILDDYESKKTFKKNEFKIQLQLVGHKVEKQDKKLDQIPCPRCTYLNVGVRTCEMCDQILFNDFL